MPETDSKTWGNDIASKHLHRDSDRELPLHQADPHLLGDLANISAVKQITWGMMNNLQYMISFSIIEILVKGVEVNVNVNMVLWWRIHYSLLQLATWVKILIQFSISEFQLVKGDGHSRCNISPCSHHIFISIILHLLCTLWNKT